MKSLLLLALFLFPLAHAENVRPNILLIVSEDNGEEELYDLVSDPHEWHNIAGKPSSKPVISPLSLHLPQTWTKPIPSKSSFTFNPKTYTWTPKKP